MNRNTKRLSAAESRLASGASEACKALSDESRVKILLMLSSGSTNAGDLTDELNISQPTLSHHLKVLAQAGVVKSVKDGKWRIYELTAQGERITKFIKESVK